MSSCFVVPGLGLGLLFCFCFVFFVFVCFCFVVVFFFGGGSIYTCLVAQMSKACEANRCQDDSVYVQLHTHITKKSEGEGGEGGGVQMEERGWNKLARDYQCLSSWQVYASLHKRLASYVQH